MEMLVIVSGYFNPLHVGHLEYFNTAKQLGDKLIVIVNNDNQVLLKKGKLFMKEDERVKIVESIKGVDKVILSIDKDRTVKETLKSLPKSNYIFFNDGDVDKCNEEDICKQLNIKVVYGLGEKIQSSSNLLKQNIYK